MTILLNKRKVYSRLQDEKAVLYNYVTNLLLDRTFTQRLVPDGAGIEIVASRKETNRFLNRNFSGYLERQLVLNPQVQVAVKIRTPAQEKCRQAVDFVSWAIFRKYEWGDSGYYDLIREKMVEENWLFR